MCNLGEGIYEEVWSAGVEKGILGNIKSIMRTMNLSVEKAMDALEITGSDRKKYSDALLSLN